MRIKPQRAWGWRRALGCAAAGLALASGCEDAPREAPVSDARPLSVLRQSGECRQCDHTATLAEPELIPLPAVDGAEASDAGSLAQGERVAHHPGQNAVTGGVSTRGPQLLPPEPAPWGDFTELPPVDGAAAPRTQELGSDEPDAADAHLAAVAAVAKLLLADARPPVTGEPTGAVVAERAQARIRRGYELAHRGANFAARGEFLQVLRMIAEAKDQAHGDRRRTAALACGLRALEEANDFAPRGAEPDAEVSVAVIVSSHRTPVAKSEAATQLAPRQLADLYFRYAQLQLGAAVGGEPAGSMALHALGKLHSQLGRLEPESYPQADRHAFALQHAALLARDDNHLAAHELGVLLAESGHYLESEHLLSQVASREPHPMVLRNLARVQRRLGREQLAVVSERQAAALAAGRPSGGSVVWVPPAKLAESSDPLAPRGAAVASAPAKPSGPQAAARPGARGAAAGVTRLPGGYMR